MSNLSNTGANGTPGSAGSTGNPGGAGTETNTSTDPSNSATATGGDGGQGGVGDPNAGAGGAGGTATATTTTTDATGINATATATGGTGGAAGTPGAGGLGAAGGGGGSASATATLADSTASRSSSDATATGGDAGTPSSGGPGITGGAGGTATAAATTTEDGGAAAATAAATGGNSAASVGGNGIDGASASATATGKGTAATVQATSLGGDGGTATGAGNTGGNGASLPGLAFATDSAVATATASSGEASADATATGGTGGAGSVGAQGGAGGDATLTNAVVGASSGTVSLIQSVTGGGGGSSTDTTGTGGAGGSATSTLTETPTSNPLTAMVNATGGLGGSGATGGVGGTATATVESTTAGTTTISDGVVVSQSANAQAGDGGSSSTAVGGAGGNASATDTGTSSSGIGAFSVESQAVAGSGGSGTATGANGSATATSTANTVLSAVSTLAPGTAYAQSVALAQNGGASTTLGSGTATSTATTANGLLANGFAEATGGAGSVNATAITSGGTLIQTLTATSGAVTDGQTYAGATAEELTADSGPSPESAPDNSYAAAGGLATFPGLGPNVSAAFSNPAMVNFGTGSFGAVYSPNATGVQTYTSSISWDVNTASLPAGGALNLGLVTSVDAIGALTSLTFTLTEGSTVVFDPAPFTSAAAANTFFDDDLRNLGPALAGVAGELNVTASLSETLSGTGSAYGADFMLGDAPCFAAGTRILTTRGEVAVEHLKPGDRAVSAFGRTCEIIWTGHREVDCEHHPVPADVRPVRIRAGAFWPGVPARSLWLSPDHAVFVDLAGDGAGAARGVLIPARYLVNDTTVVQEAMARVAYWHVECARHEVLLAEGLQAESYLDTGNRGGLVGAGLVPLHPDFAIGAREMWEQFACRPLVEAGPALDAARAHLAARAAAMGFETLPFHRVDLDHAGVIEALVPPGTRCVHLVSACWVPDGDKRRLGVGIDAITLDGSALPLGDPCLGSGFHAIEQYADGAYRWTNGEGVLQFAPSDQPRVLAVSVLMTVPRPDRLHGTA